MPPSCHHRMTLEHNHARAKGPVAARQTDLLGRQSHGQSGYRTARLCLRRRSIWEVVGARTPTCT